MRESLYCSQIDIIFYFYLFVDGNINFILLLAILFIRSLSAAHKTNWVLYPTCTVSVSVLCVCVFAANNLFDQKIELKKKTKNSKKDIAQPKEIDRTQCEFESMCFFFCVQL